MKDKFLFWLTDTRAATAIEYGMLMVGISIAIMGIVFTMGDDLVIIFEKIDTKLTENL